ncbi:MAG: PTS sugar transporter subunit IIA [Acidimicrobiales bacterium]
MSTVVVSPCDGEALSLDDVPDPVFAERIMGDGMAVRPNASQVVAPVSGRIEKLFEGGHAFVIETASGVQVLVHVGLETVMLKGDGFRVQAAEGDTVEAGAPIVHADFAAIAAKGLDPVTPVVVISEHAVSDPATGPVRAGDPLFRAG